MVGREPPDLKGVRAKFKIQGLSFWYGPSQALFDISSSDSGTFGGRLDWSVGCGKSTFLRTLNRMNDLFEAHGTRESSSSTVRRFTAADVDLVDLRRRVGMVFQKSNPFPKSIFENVVFGPRSGRSEEPDSALRNHGA